jgi:hypothetical protein
LSNAFGLTNLTVTEVTIALPDHAVEGTPAIQPKSLQKVTFSGLSNINIPNAGLAVSDPLDFPVKPLTVITVSIYLAEGQQGGAITSHPGSRENIFMSLGNWAGATNLTDSSVQTVAHWLVTPAQSIVGHFHQCTAADPAFSL